jgi:sugar lactone lactonase YvrE
MNRPAERALHPRATRHPAVAAVVLACLVPPPGFAQSGTGNAIVDSARVARTAWAAGTSALRAGDTTVARREIDRAAQAWPTQPVYPWGSAVLASRTRDTTALRQALTAYADLGLGRDLRADSTIASYLALPGFDAIAARHDAQRAPLVRSAVRVTLGDSTLWPEGVAWDPRERRFFVASIRHGTIVEVRADGGGERELLPRGQRDVASVLAVAVDTARRALWATASPVGSVPGDSATRPRASALLRIALPGGALARRWDLPTGQPHTLGDVAVGPRGDVFVSDSDDPALYRLRPGADTLEALRHVLFRSLQGIAVTPDPLVLYVADYSHGLLRVDLADHSVTRLADAPGSTSLGVDGLAWDRGSLIAIQNGVAPARVMRFTLDASGRRIERAEVLDRNPAVADEPTIGVVVGDEFIYVANSQWEKYAPNGSRVRGTRLTAPRLLALPLSR